MSTETAEKNRIINNRKIRFNHFLLLSKKSFFYYNKLSVVALSIIFSFMMAITAGTSAFAGEDVTSSSGEQFTLYDYLNKHKNAPVELLNSLYYAVDSEPVTKSKSRFPFFTPVEYKEKSAALQRLPLHPLPEEKLNGLLSFRDVINYIDQKKLVPATNILIFNYLLTMYCTWYERDYNLPVAQTITIKGMLSDLEQQAQRKDDIAILILSFLKQPYCVNDIFARKSGQPFSVFLQKSMKNLFFPEPSFSEQLSMFLDNGYPSMAYTRWKRIPPLHKQYGHRKNHLFTSYEFDETGKDISSSSANLIPTAKEMNEIFNEYEEDQRISASTETRIKSAKGLTNLLFVAGVAFAQVVSANAASVPPRQQCEPGSNCQIQGPLSLYANNFYQMLEGNPRSNFQLGENIILNGKNHSSLYPFCSKPFSGSIQTGNYTLDVGDITDPLFGCTQNAHLCGNFNLCPVNDTQGAVIARQVADGNLFNIQQTQWCDGPQRSLAEDIMGQGNEITFTGIKNATVMVAEGTGIIANKVSGDSNRITLKESGELFDAPLIHEVSGNENIFYQNAVSATTGTDSYFPDNKKIAAKHFTGTDNVVKQHGSHLTFVVDAAGQSQNPTITVNRRAPVLVASDTVMTLLSEQEKGSDNGLQGSGMASNNDSTATSLICLEPDNSLNSLSFLSGELERKTNCSLSRCPLQWDVAGVASSTDLSTLCGGSKKIDTRTISGWLKAYAPHCLTEILHDDQCICYLPNEQLLGVVSTNNRSNEIWLTSRRTYTVNPDLNKDGLVRLTPLSHKNNEDIRILRANGESLVIAQPTTQLITRQHLLALYPGDQEGESVQLFWAQLSDKNSIYNAKTFFVNGNPLLLTEDSMLISDPINSNINLYKLNIQTSDSNAITVNPGNTPYESINFPDNVANAITATIKNGWLYVATTNNVNTQSVDVMRYSTTSGGWDPDWKQTYPLDTRMTYRINVNDENVIQFLLPGEIVLDKRVALSIPAQGGCLSLPKGILTAEPTAGSSKNNTLRNKLISASAAVLACGVVIAITGAYITYHGCNKKNPKTSNNNDEITDEEIDKAVPDDIGETAL